MKHIEKLTCLAVVSCASLTYAQLDAGDCGLRGMRCERKDSPCTTSDGRPGLCRQQTDGCECAPHNVCHLDRKSGMYAGLALPPNAVAAHLGHGDCLIDDGVGCTIDRCDPILGCVHVTDDSRCDDGLFCTTEACTAEGCTALSTCPAGINGCVFVNDSCDEDNDACVDRPDDSLCDDGNVCNGLEVCDAATGDCVIDSIISCDDSNLCTVDSCDPSAGCVYAPVNCGDANPCTIDACDPDAGCRNTPVDCDDGNVCNGQEFCFGLSGGCFSGTPLVCDDLDLCTADSCDSASGCVYTPLSCDDESLCTADSCDPSQGCQNVQTVVCDDECRGELCDPDTGACGPPLVNGTACDDGDECTFGDACHQAVCVGIPCSATQTCCAGAGCVDLSSNNAHCGTCGNACQGSTCFQGTCVEGCVIGGVFYPNGTRNPANNCQACNTSASRTSWVNLGTSFTNPFEYSCSQGCFTGWCSFGECVSLGGSGGCQSTTCAASACVDGQCTFTAQNEGAACAPPLSTSVCRSSSSGVCRSGQCVGNSINTGQACIVEPDTTVPICHSNVSGTCNSTGGCVTNRLPEGSSCPGPNLCQPGTCKTVLGTFDCWTTPKDCSVRDVCGEDGTCDTSSGRCIYPGPLPDNGDVNCGGWVEGYLPDRCCPGQVCICNPFDVQWCIIYECWWPEEIPDDPFP